MIPGALRSFSHSPCVEVEQTVGTPFKTAPVGGLLAINYFFFHLSGICLFDFRSYCFKAFLLPPTASIKADGVAAYYEVMFRHWDAQLKDLHAQRVARKEAAESLDPTSSEILIIDDDDGDSNAILELEEKSLINAHKGIITIVDGSGDATLDDILPAPEEPSPAAADQVDDRIAKLRE